MPRRIRIEFPGAVYHVMNRGDRGEIIFQDDEDRSRFVDTLAEACKKTGWLVHAYCLMPNHFHLVAETPQPNLVAGMKWLLGTYTGRYNRRHKVHGHLFSGRYKAVIVDSQNRGYLKTACDYVHLNPVRARLLRNGQRLKQYRWSSFPDYLAGPTVRPNWVRVDRLLGEWGVSADRASGRRVFEREMEDRRAGPEPDEFKDLRRGWYFGAASSRDAVLSAMDRKVGRENYGSERRETNLQKAERIVAEELKRVGWTEETLAGERKGAPTKVRIARRLRVETTVTLRWISERLRMGSPTYLPWLFANVRENGS